MKEISQLLKGPLRKGLQTQIGRIHSDDEKKVIEIIFETFKVTYPFWMHNKTKDEVKTAKRLWTRDLNGMPSDAIAKALDSCRTGIGHRSGPTIGEFLKLCRTEPAHKDFKLALPKPENYAVGRAALDNIRATLNMGVTR